MAAFYADLNVIIHGLRNEMLPKFTDGFINPQMSAYRGLMVKAKDNQNKLLRHDNFRLPPPQPSK
jgi:hypothetical protein